MNESNTQTMNEDCVVIGDIVKIRRRGRKGIWVAHFHHQGEHRKRSLKTANKEIARKRAIQLEAELTRGEYVQRPRAVGIQQTVDEYLELKRGERRAHKTMLKYTQWLNDFVKFAAENDVRYLAQIDGKLFEQFRAHKRSKLAEKSVTDGLTIIKQLLKWVTGHGRDYLQRNPLIQFRLSKSPPRPVFTPSTELVHLLLDAATGMRKVHYAMLAWTGMRSGEEIMLRVRDVDLKQGWIRVNSREEWEPKTGNSRMIPIHPKLAEIVATVPSSDRPYFFCAPPSREYPKGDHHLNPRSLLTDFQDLARKFGLPIGREDQGIVVHALRHYFETTAIDSGVPKYVVDAWMGHSDPSMGRQYYYLPAEKKQKYMQQVQF